MVNKIRIPRDAAFIINKLEENGYEAYVVGGCVRDSLLGIEPHDWDICTSALPEQVIEVFKEYNVDIATASNIINNFNFIKELKVWIFITYEEKTGYYKVNLRSRGPVINTIASKYHGGGHKFASGAKLHTRDEIPMLINDLDEVCKNFKCEE